MEVILCENVDNLGAMGQTVKVSDGYARNYLIPRKLAVEVSSGTAKKLDHEKRVIRRREEKLRAAMMAVARSLEELTVDIPMRAGEEDKIFGSVTSALIAQRLKELGRDIDRRHIHLEEPIKSLGIFSVPARLAPGIEANLKVWVTKEAEPEESA